MQSIRISIVVPNFNQRVFLAETLESILAQAEEDVEVLVIDGGSTDGSVDVIRRYEDRLAYWCSEPDEGHYDAVNKGMAKTTGDVLAFVNSDDKLFPGSLQVVRDVFDQHASVRWISSLLPAAWDVAGSCIAVSVIPGYSPEAFWDGRYGGGRTKAPWFIQQESTFWRRSLWEQAGGRIRTEISLAGDFDLWARFFQHAELVGVNALLGGFRLRDGQRGAEGTRYRDQCQEVLSQTKRSGGRALNVIRTAALGSRAFGVKNVGGLLRRTVGYRGQRLLRKAPGSESASWTLQDYRFP